MGVRRRIKDRTEPLLVQNLAPPLHGQARAAWKPQRHVLRQPPSIQQPESHMREQALADDLVEQQQPVGSERCLDVAQRPADVPRRVQHVGRNHDIIAARINPLPRDRLLNVKNAVAQIGMLRPVNVLCMQQECLRQIRVAILRDARPVRLQARQHPHAGAPGPRSYLDNAKPRRRLLPQSLLDEADRHPGEHLVEVVRNRIVLVDSLHQPQRAVREHHVRRPHRAAENAGKRTQRRLNQLDLGRDSRVCQPLSLTHLPFPPARFSRRHRLPSRRVRFTVLPEIATRGENAQTLVQPSIVGSSQAKPRLDLCDVRPPAGRKARSNQLGPQQPASELLHLTQRRSPFKQLASRRLHQMDRQFGSS